MNKAIRIEPDTFLPLHAILKWEERDNETIVITDSQGEDHYFEGDNARKVRALLHKEYEIVTVSH